MKFKIKRYRKMKNKIEKLRIKNYKKDMKFFKKLVRLFHKFYKSDDFIQLDFDEIKNDLYKSYINHK